MARATHGGTAEQSDTAYQAVGSVSAFGVHPDLHSASLAPSFQHHSNDDGTGQQIQTPQQWRLGQWQRLHLEIEEFAKCSAPSSRDLRAVEAAVESVRREAAALWPESRTYLFGSQASGLSLPSSDLDIVILNASTSVLSAAHGFSSEAKLQVTARLKKLLKRLRTANVITAGLVIGRARIPIIKASTKQGNYSLDISMGTTNGAAAVCLLRHQVQAVPPLRPLALVIRALLKVHGLNEVYTGGLSSYSITWAILAHLQQEGFQIANPSASAGILPLKTLPSYHMMPAVSYNAQLDLGALLHGFLCRYGLHFNSNEEAVSVLHGGFMQKPASWRNDQKPWLLAVEDPQDPGRDIAAGSFEISRVFRAFADAATNLAAANDSMNDIMQVPHMALDLQRFPILSCILDMDLALSPSQPPQVARRPAQFAMHVPHKRSHSQYTAGNDHKSSAQQENTHFQQQRKPKRAKMALSPKKQNRADKQARQEYSNRGKHARGGRKLQGQTHRCKFQATALLRSSISRVSLRQKEALSSACSS